MMYELQKFYYDAAQAFNPYTLPSFKKDGSPIAHFIRHGLPSGRRLGRNRRQRADGEWGFHGQRNAKHRSRERAGAAAETEADRRYST